MPKRIKGDWLRTVLALAAISAGFVVFWFPIPVGALLMVFGAALLISHSRRAAAAVLRLRKRRPRFDRIFLLLEARAPLFFREKLERTNPGRYEG
jgi:hypothetical protein